MEWITDASGPLRQFSGCIATLGVFDGVHVGHRAILDRTLTWARTENRPAVVVTFSVHPDEVVRGKAPPLLMSLEHRRRELERCGLDATLVLDFNEELRRREAEDFVENILVHRLALRGLVLGHDTAVGKDRRGNAKLLDALGRQHGFAVQVVGEISVDGTVISSTRIRKALQQGALEEVSRLLGRAPSLLGTVVEGDGRGRTIGFPTANLDVSSECRPGEGVYAVLVLVQGKRYHGLCNIGRRPTFLDSAPPMVEVHLLDFDGDLYGQRLEVVFLERLRGEQTFAGVDELRQQIQRDREHSARVFRRHHGGTQDP